MQTITFNTFRSLNSARHNGISLFSTIFTLQNTRVHISFSNSSDISFYIKALIDKVFGLTSTFQMFIQMIDISDFREILITCSFEVRITLSKI